jgi:hypothetical protein
MDLVRLRFRLILIRCRERFRGQVGAFVGDLGSWEVSLFILNFDLKSFFFNLFELVLFKIGFFIQNLLKLLILMFFLWNWFRLLIYSHPIPKGMRVERTRSSRRRSVCTMHSPKPMCGVRPPFPAVWKRMKSITRAQSKLFLGLVLGFYLADLFSISGCLDRFSICLFVNLLKHLNSLFLIPHP